MFCSSFSTRARQGKDKRMLFTRFATPYDRFLHVFRCAQLISRFEKFVRSAAAYLHVRRLLPVYVVPVCHDLAPQIPQLLRISCKTTKHRNLHAKNSKRNRFCKQQKVKPSTVLRKAIIILHPEIKEFLSCTCNIIKCNICNIAQGFTVTESCFERLSHLVQSPWR